MIVNPKRIIEEKLVFPVEEEQIQPNGIDLTLGEVYAVLGSGTIHKGSVDRPPRERQLPNQEGYFRLIKDQMYDVVCNEGCKIPDGMVAKIEPRSSLVRSGALIQSGLYDSGYECDKIGFFLFAHKNVTLEQNARVVQIIFYEADSYEEYSGQYQDGKGWLKEEPNGKKER